MTTDEGKPYLTTEEAARYVGVSRRTLERAVAEDRVPSVRNPLTNRRQFERAQLDALMRREGGSLR